jgi:hypothetical protein
MLVSLKKQKNAKSGLPHGTELQLYARESLQLLVPMTFRALMPTRPAQAGQSHRPLHPR